VAKRRPLELLRGIRAPWLPLEPVDTSSVQDAPWRDALAAASQLWYTRRRNLSYSSAFAGEARELGGNERDVERALEERVDALGLSTRWKRMRERSSASATAEMVRMLTSSKFQRSPTLLAAAIHELETGEATERKSVLGVRERYSAPGFGEGLMRLERAAQDLGQDKNLVKKVAQSGAVPELDALARMASERDLARLADEVSSHARADSARKLGEFARSRFKEIGS
jgi:hypothetical protein